MKFVRAILVHEIIEAIVMGYFGRRILGQSHLACLCHCGARRCFSIYHMTYEQYWMCQMIPGTRGYNMDLEARNDHDHDVNRCATAEILEILCGKVTPGSPKHALGLGLGLGLGGANRKKRCHLEPDRISL